MGQGHALSRRAWLAGAAASPLATLAACQRDVPMPPARWIGASHERGHRLREPFEAPREPLIRHAGVLIAGAGIAGLAAARALTRAGIDDVHLLELEDEPGGNSRGHSMSGVACPRGAHYLPLPGPFAESVAALLDEFGLRRSVAGRAVYDERHLCHSPQERLFIDGAWHEGLLPPVESLPASQREATRAQYRRLAALVAAQGQANAFRIPTAAAPWTDALAALDGQTFAAWLDGQGLTAPALRWYLDYCCRDDYGAGTSGVSAWAGLHYFASRHGFAAPGESDGGEGLLTWPEGNAWLARRLAAPLADRLHAGRIVQRIDASRHEVAIDAWDAAANRAERWVAPHVIVALPLFVAARLLVSPPAALAEAVALQTHAPWLVANLHLQRPLTDRSGAAPAWDNVVYGGSTLGYVDAMHQSLRPQPGPTVLTLYHAPGGDSPEAVAANRRRLLALDAGAAAREVIEALRPVHPDLPLAVTAIDLMRYGHAMSIPRPGVRGSAALRALAATSGRVHFAHADLSGYSVFEEALQQGERAATAVVLSATTR
jgi:monoamine oxidase